MFRINGFTVESGTFYQVESVIIVPYPCHDTTCYHRNLYSSENFHSFKIGSGASYRVRSREGACQDPERPGKWDPDFL